MDRRQPIATQDRRQWLAESSLGFGSIALAHLLAGDGLAGTASAARQSPGPVPHKPGGAQSVIFLFMQGGPSHLETFDPKPVLRRMDGQSLPESFKDINLAQTNTSDGRLMGPAFPFYKHGESGLEMSDRFPHLARHADDLAVIRSCFHETFIHGPAVTMMSTGTLLLGHPSIGSWVVYGLGSANNSLPAYVAMTDTYIVNSSATFGSGFLPEVFQGTFMRTKGAPIQNLSRPQELTARDQRLLLDQLNRWNRQHADARGGDSRLEARIADFETAFRMQTAAPELIDITGEPQHVRDLYGMDAEPTARFGGMCLLARRMVERGVRYVHLVNNGWDSHGENKQWHEERTLGVDRPVAGLLTDLKQRGLLEDTLVVWAGEFGRTPIKQGARGRDHHPYGFSAWMAGGGIRGGKVIGATDELGFHAVQDRVHTNDLHATMLSLLGLDHKRLTYFFEGRNRRLTDAGGENNLADRLTA